MKHNFCSHYQTRPKAETAEYGKCQKLLESSPLTLVCVHSSHHLVEDADVYLLLPSRLLLEGPERGRHLLGAHPRGRFHRGELLRPATAHFLPIF